MTSVLITGSAKRVGKAIALHLAQQGHNIIIHYHSSEEEALQTANEVKNIGQRCSIIQANLDNPQERNQLISNTFSLYPDCNILINNASVFLKDSFINSTEALFDKHMNIHVKTPYFLSQQFAKHCTQGNIINMIDSMITRNTSEHFSYLLSKKALMELNNMLAKHLAPNIRVNCIAPNIIKEFSEEVAPETKQHTIEQTLLQTLTSMEDVNTMIDTIINTPTITGQCILL